MKKRGSVTIEAAISMVVFMMFIMFVMNLMLLVNKEMDMQMDLNNTAKRIAKNMFYVEMAEELSKSGSDENPENIRTRGEALNKALLAYNMLGTNMLKSTIENGMVDLVIEYPVKVPLVKRYFPMCQRARVKDWSGTDITENSETVYITKTGTVYHRSRECSYLNINIRKTTVRGLAKERNSGGGKYSACEYCISGTLNRETIVYITSDGSRYHSSLQCQSLTRSIMEIDISQVGDRRPCSKCGQEK